MKKGLLLAFALLASSFSASAATIYITLDLVSAVGNNGTNLLGTGTGTIGVGLAPGATPTKGANLGSSQTNSSAKLTYVFGGVFLDADQSVDVTANFLNGEYTLNNVVQLDYGVLYRDNSNDAATEGFRVDVTRADFSAFSGQQELGGAAGSFSSSTDSFAGMTLNTGAISSLLNSYVLAGGLNPTLGVVISTTDGNWKLRSVNGSLIITGDATYTPPPSGVPEPSTTALAGSALVGAAFLLRRRK